MSELLQPHATGERDSAISGERPTRIRFVTPDAAMVETIIHRMRSTSGDWNWHYDILPPEARPRPRWREWLLGLAQRAERLLFRTGLRDIGNSDTHPAEDVGTIDAIAYIGCTPSLEAPPSAKANRLIIEVRWPNDQAPLWAALAAVVERADALTFNWVARNASRQLASGAVRSITTCRASETAGISVSKAVAMSVDVTRKYVAGGAGVGWQAPPDHANRLAGAASASLLMRYVATLVWRETKKRALARVLGTPEWHLYVRRGPPWQAHAEPEVAHGNPPGRFLADPFVVSSPDGDYIFAEDYAKSEHSGYIGAFRIQPDGALVDLGLIIREHVHLSFPFIFRIGQDWYMCPESSGYRQVRLYRSKSFPLEWHHVATPLSGVSAADPMIFQHAGRWWLLANIDSSGGRDHCTELHVYSSDDPLSENWQPHPMNPVVTDCRCARNAGLLVDGDRILRVAQVQAFDSYGDSLVLREIVTLSKESYAERPAPTPPNLPDVRLRHHLSATANWTVSDKRTF